MKKSKFSRRTAIKLGSFSLVSLGFIRGINEASAEDILAKNKPLKPNLNSEEALELLLSGNQRFISGKLENTNVSFNRIQEVAKGQNPFAAILGCADSRVPLEILFDRGFGDLFVVRNAGNIVTAEETGSLEYGALIGAKVILVLGHESCGAVTATIANKPVPGNIQSVLNEIKPALDSLNTEQKKDVETVVKANVKLQVENLKKSSVLSNLIAENKLQIVGGYYDLDTAKVTLI